jgi:hypothetical protein
MVMVDSIGVEDNSGTKWLLNLCDNDGKLGSVRLVAHYDTTLREGVILPVTG